DVLAHGDRELGFGAEEFLRLDVLAQPDNFALAVRYLDADGALAGHAFDEDAFGAQGEAEIVGEADNAAVFDAGFGLEFEGGDDRAGVDLRDLAEDFELRVLRGQNLSDYFELFFVYGLLLVGTVEQARGREFVTARDFGEDRFRAVLGVGAVGHFDCGRGGERRVGRRGEGVVCDFLGHAFDACAGG